MSDSVYFLHIPKTGGRFIRNNIFRYLGEHLSNIGIDAKTKDIQVSHKGIFSLKDNQYSFSFFRDPVKRMVSHYLFFNAIFSEDFSVEDKNIMMDWIESQDNLYNYQSKYLSYCDNNLYENFNHIPFLETDINDVMPNISRLNRFHRTSDINNNLVLSIFNDIQDYLELPEKVLDRPIIVVGTEINVASESMYSLLSESDKQLIAELNSVDMEIYNTDSLFTS